MMPRATPVHRPQPRRARTCAFTLVETMIAISLIVVLIGALGVALLGRGGEGAALSSAQSTVASLLGAARAQAAVSQRPVLVLVYAATPPAGDASKYLRYLQLVRDESTNPTGSTQLNARTLVSIAPPVELPAGIRVVPPTNILTTTGVTWVTNTTNGPISLFVSRLPSMAVRVDGQPFGGTTGGQAYFVEFTPDGRATASFVAGGNVPPKIALATATASANAAPQFNNPQGVRGLLIRFNGAVTRVNDANSF